MRSAWVDAPSVSSVLSFHYPFHWPCQPHLPVAISGHDELFCSGLQLHRCFSLHVHMASTRKGVDGVCMDPIMSQTIDCFRKLLLTTTLFHT